MKLWPWFFVLPLVSCGSLSGQSLRSQLRTAEAKISVEPVESSKAAEHLITNRLNFLKALFEQSIDPYFGTARWSPECLAANKIGEVKQTARGLVVVSELLLNQEFAPGFCFSTMGRDAAVAPYYQIWSFCQGGSTVEEIIVSTSKLKLPQDWDDLCR